ncbi:MAG: GlmU family protein [Candidatus Cyclobacteriaceae bacterium M3_2C_046]
MNTILFDQPDIKSALLPLTYTKPVGKLRVGILTIEEKWQRFIKDQVSYLTEEYLKQKFQLQVAPDNWLINGAVCPDQELWQAIQQLETGQGIFKDDILLAAKCKEESVERFARDKLLDLTHKTSYPAKVDMIRYSWDIFSKNREQIIADFALITQNRESQPINDPHTIVYGQENLFLEEGVQIKAAIINAEKGPVYIGKNATIQEGAVVRGAFALCEGSTVNVGAKVRGDSTVGPYSKIGGEVSNSVIQGYSNKGHDGFLGNAVLGEWCNIGADSNNSNLKNNYAGIKVWSYQKESFVNTGLQFCGLVMGDHSKCGINTMFNTGTVVGVSANIFGAGFPRTFIPSFAWGGAAGFSTFALHKVYETAELVMQRRNVDLTEADKAILTHVFEVSRKYRKWEAKPPKAL